MRSLNPEALAQPKSQFLNHVRYILADAPSQQLEYFKSFEENAQEHADTIEKFGRFPYRNKVLNRKSTPEEIEFLKDY